jgi:hypothetical protein
MVGFTVIVEIGDSGARKFGTLSTMGDPFLYSAGSHITLTTKYS